MPRLDWPACLNVRDLGGFRAAYGKVTRLGSIVRSDNLARLTEAGREALVTYGVRNVIDLRDPREVSALPNPFAVRPDPAVSYRNVPLISDEEWDAARRGERGYVLTVKLSSRNVAAVLSALAEAEGGGVVIHCNAGKERTGVVVAILLSIAGVDDEVIAEDWIASDDYLRPLFEEWLRDVTDEQERARRLDGLRARPEQILDVLRYLRAEHGGVEEYLVRSGVSVSHVEFVRRRLL